MAPARRSAERETRGMAAYLTRDGKDSYTVPCAGVERLLFDAPYRR